MFKSSEKQTPIMHLQRFVALACLVEWHVAHVVRPEAVASASNQADDNLVVSLEFLGPNASQRRPRPHPLPPRPISRARFRLRRSSMPYQISK